MINLIKGEVNEMILTLTEKVTVTSPVFLFHFKHQTLVSENAFILADNSQYTERYNLFSFTEGSNTAKTFQEGIYYYTIYAQADVDNLDPDLADEEVERGICRVTTSRTSFTQYNPNTTYSQHGV